MTRLTKLQSAIVDNHINAFIAGKFTHDIPLNNPNAVRALRRGETIALVFYSFFGYITRLQQKRAATNMSRRSKQTISNHFKDYLNKLEIR